MSFCSPFNMVSSDDTLRRCRNSVFFLVCLVNITVMLVVYYELYNPGCGIARELVTMVYILLAAIVVFSLPLIKDKVQRYDVWVEKLNKMDDDERYQARIEVAKPIVKDLLILVLMCIIAIVVVQAVGPYVVPPEVMENYERYLRYGVVP